VAVKQPELLRVLHRTVLRTLTLAKRQFNALDMVAQHYPELETVRNSEFGNELELGEYECCPTVP
jgi:hypothetical protein